MIKMKIHSVTGTVFDGEVAHVTFPGEMGRFAVFPMHAPILSNLIRGDIVCFAANEEKTAFAIRSGFAEVKNNQASACVELLVESDNG
jgi:F-type H+-transporting ATPase subunit epsilon